MAYAKLPKGLVAVVPFNVDIGIITRDVWIEQVYDRFYCPRNDDVVIDVGAHVGLFTLKVAKKVKKVVAIEPHPLNYRFLIANITLNGLKNVIPLKLALSSYSGKAKLYLRDSGTSTLIDQHPP